MMQTKKNIVTKHGFKIQTNVLNILFYISANDAKAYNLVRVSNAKIFCFPLFSLIKHETRFGEANRLNFPATEKLPTEDLNKS